MLLLGNECILKWYNVHMKKIIVGMSGGVDSSVAALLLQQQGYHVEGLFMKNWQEDDSDEYCAAAQDAQDAQAVCHKLGIQLHTVNFSQQYWNKVFDYFLHEYQCGRTPNPDILCNKEIKFRAFLDYALEKLRADGIATGHYVRKQQTTNGYQLLKGVDDNKDQSYFLYRLSQAQLAPTLFPIGELNKPKVREIAKQQGFITHNKKDSTGICFIGERKFKDFLQHYLPAKPGDICTIDGEVIGKHDGLMYYTIGQRQGLNIGGLANKSEAAWYVAKKDLTNNRLLVVQGSQHPALYKKQLLCSQVHWINGCAPRLPFTCRAKTRYRQQDEACQIELLADDQLCVHFSQDQRAITPGQSVVFYDQQTCLGGAIIDE